MYGSAKHGSIYGSHVLLTSIHTVDAVGARYFFLDPSKKMSHVIEGFDKVSIRGVYIAHVTVISQRGYN